MATDEDAHSVSDTQGKGPIIKDQAEESELCTSLSVLELEAVQNTSEQPKLRPFVFLQLPWLARNAIYEELLVDRLDSKNGTETFLTADCEDCHTESKSMGLGLYICPECSQPKDEYRLLLEYHGHLHISYGTHTSILRTCRDIYQEAVDVLYRNNPTVVWFDGNEPAQISSPVRYEHHTTPPSVSRMIYHLNIQVKINRSDCFGENSEYWPYDTEAVQKRLLDAVTVMQHNNFDSVVVGFKDSAAKATNPWLEECDDRDSLHHWSFEEFCNQSSLAPLLALRHVKKITIRGVHPSFEKFLVSMIEHQSNEFGQAEDSEDKREWLREEALDPTMMKTMRDRFARQFYSTYMTALLAEEGTGPLLTGEQSWLGL